MRCCIVGRELTNGLLCGKLDPCFLQSSIRRVGNDQPIAVRCVVLRSKIVVRRGVAAGLCDWLLQGGRPRFLRYGRMRALCRSPLRKREHDWRILSLNGNSGVYGSRGSNLCSIKFDNVRLGNRWNCSTLASNLLEVERLKPRFERRWRAVHRLDEVVRLG